MTRKVLTKSRFLYLHPAANAEKVAALDALQERYAAYLKTCVECMIAAHRINVPMPQRQAFFPRCDGLTSQIVKNARAHAVGIVSGWVAGKYLSNLRRHIKTLYKVRLIDEPMRACLCIIGKRGVDQVDKKVTQQALDLYWRLLLDEEVAGKQPTISRRCGMRMSEMTAVLDVSDTTRLTKWWLAFSHLVPGKRIQLPLVGTPYVTSIDQASKGILARKSKHGRWRFEVVDTKAWEIPVATRDMPRVGLDVGLNVMAAHVQCGIREDSATSREPAAPRAQAELSTTGLLGEQAQWTRQEHGRRGRKRSGSCLSQIRLRHRGPRPERVPWAEAHGVSSAAP
jgi:hypothetical protein